jgi:ABC-2 type transport system permease protein
VRQLDAELRRFFSRRMVRGTLLIAALIVVISVGIATGKGHRSQASYFDPVTGRVSQQNSGTTDQTPIYFGSDTRMDVGKSLEHALEGTGVALLFAGLALGASFVGAEFNVGSLTTQLLFEPRRWRVHIAKAAAVAIGAALFAFAVMLLVALSMYVGSAAHGVVQGVDGTFVAHRVGEALRIAAAVAAGATMAYCVTLVAKRSSAGIVAFFVQYPLLFLLDPAKMPFGLVSHYSPLRGLLAVVIDPATATGANERAIHTMAGGVVLTVSWVAIAVGLSGLLFARAEVR